MSREVGDPCPHCKDGKLTVHSDREIYENTDGDSGDHKTWLCDKCGKITRDFSRGLKDNIDNISDSIQVQKGVSRELKDEIGTSDGLTSNRTVDTQSIIEKYSIVYEVNEVMGIWEINIEGCPVTLKIKVIKHSNMSEHQYMGIANYEIQNPTQHSPYASLRNCDTVEDALKDALDGFITYFKSELVDETKFVLNEDWL